MLVKVACDIGEKMNDKGEQLDLDERMEACGKMGSLKISSRLPIAGQRTTSFRRLRK
jgi:hypothetical protein